MSKPILWLGPLEEVDADFDPLLGRSAAATQTQPVFSARKATLDPARSVFDDPAPDVVAPATNQTQQAEPDLVWIQEPSQETSLPQPLAEVRPDIEHGPKLGLDAAPVEVEPAFIEPVQSLPDPEPEPEPELAAVSDEVIDYSHNNDPIPARQEDIAEPEKPVNAATFSPAFGSDTDEEVEPIADAPKKSFFTNLFARRTITPVVTATSASINDIWAKVEPVPELQVEQQVEVDVEGDLEPDAVSEAEAPAEPDAAPEAGPQPDLQADAAVPEPEPEPELEPTPLRGRNIWASVDGEQGDVTPVDEPIAIEPDSSPDSSPESTPVSTSDAILASSNAESVQDTIVTNAPVTEEPKLEPEQEIVPEDAPAAPTSAASTFQNAFNADKFWSLPRGTNPPHPEAALLEATQTASLGQSEPEQSPDTLQDTGPDVGPDTKLASAPVADETTAAPVATPRVRQPATGKRRKKKKGKKSYIGAFFGTFLFGIALIMTLASSLAAFGYPFDLMSSYRWYWVISAVLAAGIFGVTRGWKMVAASFALMAVNLFVTVPASGEAPTGGNSATAVVGWANVSGNSEAMARVFKDADKKKATLLMLADAPQTVFTPPAGWTLIEAPAAGDPTAIAVLSKSTWRAATVPGEPTMARPPAGDLTVIGVHPQDAIKSRRSTPNRDALINRAGTRAGIQEGATVVVGDFNAAPWDRAMRQFSSYGNVTRVRCGGWAGATLTQAFGLIGVATDHAYVRDVKVTHCQLGGSLTGGNHKPIWLYVVPQPAPPAQATQP